LIRAARRRQAIELISEIGIGQRNLKHWRLAIYAYSGGSDRCQGRPSIASHRLSEVERQRILLACNQAGYASLSSGQIVPAHVEQKRQYNSYGEDFVYGSVSSI
jgi:hypothetical protein